MRFRNRRNPERRNPNNEEEVISLTSLCEGECGIITHTFGGFGFVRRLAEMGLTPGTEVRLLRKCSFHGPVEIETRGVALAIGYGLASKIFVRVLKAESNG